MSQAIKDSRKQALISESGLWEYLIAHDEVQDFERWVMGYRKSLG
jgi:prophage antirepressor-like protein